MEGWWPADFGCGCERRRDWKDPPKMESPPAGGSWGSGFCVPKRHLALGFDPLTMADMQWLVASKRGTEHAAGCAHLGGSRKRCRLRTRNKTR